MDGTCCDRSGGMAFLVKRVLLKALLLMGRRCQREIPRMTNTREKMAEVVLAAAVGWDVRGSLERPLPFDDGLGDHPLHSSQSSNVTG